MTAKLRKKGWSSWSVFIQSKWKVIAASTVGLAVLTVFGIVLIRVSDTYRNHESSMEKLARELIELRSAMNIDTVRQFHIQKVLKIITTHNASISSGEAYDIANTIYEMSQKYTNLNVDLLCAVITHESGGHWDPRAVSKAGALGLMQIMPVTGYVLSMSEGIPWTTPEEVTFNPIYNIRMGSRFLSMLIGMYGIDGGLAAYNGGEKQASLWLKNGKDDQYLWSETRGYIPAVFKLYDNFQSQGL